MPACAAARASIRHDRRREPLRPVRRCGCRSGAILGLRLGEKALPSFYIECLEPAETLGELAEDMLGGCTMERGSKLFDLDWDRKYIHGGK